MMAPLVPAGADFLGAMDAVAHDTNGLSGCGAPREPGPG